jgi:hypothetical protein
MNCVGIDWTVTPSDQPSVPSAFWSMSEPKKQYPSSAKSGLSEPLSSIVQVAEAVSWRSLESSGWMVHRSTAPAMPIAARRASPVF